jgi:hypothetical protein
LPERDDRHEASQWQAAASRTVRRALADAWQGQACGPALAEALLTTIEGVDAEAGNLALQLLATAALSASDWRRLAQVAVRERDQLLPDREVAVLLAQRGPRAALSTVVLTAIRPGPEDADDRLLATAALGRFDDVRVPRLLERLAATGTASLEVLQAAADALAAGQDPERWRPVLIAVLHLNDTDAWARWSALDGLSRLDPAGCIPWLVAACRSRGADLPEWYAPFCDQRLAALAPGVDPQSWRGELPSMAPLPGRAGRVHSRCARIARQAMAEWQAGGGDEAVVANRAEVELALVQRGQLLGSFVATADTQPTPLGPAWAPNWQPWGRQERDTWRAEEAAWLATARLT